MVKERGERGLRRGRPFATRQLIEKRRRQREDLRLVPQAVLSDAVAGKGASPEQALPAPDRALIEAELRDYADSLRGEADVAGILQRMALLTQAEVLGHWAREIGQQEGPAAETVRREFQNRWTTVAQNAQTLRSEANDQGADTLMKYVAALVFADEAADDDYQDCRLPK